MGEHEIAKAMIAAIPRGADASEPSPAPAADGPVTDSVMPADQPGVTWA